MSARAFRALVKLEVRRLTEITGRLVLLSVAAGTALSLVGWLTSARLALLCSVVGASFLMYGLGVVIRDKLDGGLEFLTSLPVDPRLLVLGRLLGVALAAVWATAAFSIAIWIAGPVVRTTIPGGLPGLAGGLFLTTFVASALALGLMLRFDSNRMSIMVVVLMVLLVAIDEIPMPFLDGPKALAIGLLSRSWAPAAASVLILAALILLVLLSYHLARTGIERFTPGRDRITW